jgi:hypothetical protein
MARGKCSAYTTEVDFPRLSSGGSWTRHFLISRSAQARACENYPRAVRSPRNRHAMVMVMSPSWTLLQVTNVLETADSLIPSRRYLIHEWQINDLNAETILLRPLCPRCRVHRGALTRLVTPARSEQPQACDKRHRNSAWTMDEFKVFELWILPGLLDAESKGSIKY